MTIADDWRSHCDIPLETGDNIGSLLLLVPTDSSVQTQDTNNDPKIDPVIQTCCKKDGQFHY
jgi:hypothetical protein